MRAANIKFILAVVPTKINILQVTKALKNGKFGVLSFDEGYIGDIDDPDEMTKENRRILYTVFGSVDTFMQLRNEALGLGWTEQVSDGIYSLIQ